MTESRAERAERAERAKPAERAERAKPAERAARAEPPEETANAAAGLDLLLIDGALGPLRRIVPSGGSGLRFATSLARHPALLARRGGELITELTRIARGSSTVEPSKKDKRFRDPAWTGNPLLHRTMQSYLAAAHTADSLVEDAELGWPDEDRIRFSVNNVSDALAPSNVPMLNPLAWKAVLDTGGRSVINGVRRAVSDLRSPPRVPSMVEPNAFTVGGDLATTPGAVVLRTPIFELIHYQPQTETVRTVPLLMIPPTINKFYIADLAPGRSIAEHMLGAGQQVFMISWRNPGAEHADWGLDSYGQAVLDAMDAVQTITGVDRVALMAFCSGGMITAMLLAHLAAIGAQQRVAAVSLAVTVLDQSKAGLTSALMDEHAAKAAVAKSAAQGYLDGATLAEVFAWLRPNDLVWSYWVNNYLEGKPPPAFDILYWNADTTRMAAKLHHDFIDLGLRNALSTPGAATMLGTALDLSKVDVDSYVIAGIADHLCQWQACYRTTALLGGRSRFVLSTSGHIASLVNPPGNRKATFQTSESSPADPEQWLAGATSEPGSWWPDFAAWLGDRCGPEADAPAELGGGGLSPLEPAPGTYVFEK